MHDSVIMCDEIIDAEETKTIPKNITCKTKFSIFSLTFLSITIALFIAASIYCYLIQYKVKQKRLLAFHNTNSEL